MYQPGKGHKDADAISHIKWPEAMELDTQTVHAICKGVQAPHGKVETLAMGLKQWMPYLRIRHHLA